MSWNVKLFLGLDLFTRHTLTGVWVEIVNASFYQLWLLSHPHGCVSWNFKTGVTMSIIFQSHPHGCVSWNVNTVRNKKQEYRSHPHGCVSWNATAELHVPKKHVTPSRVCELKFGCIYCIIYLLKSHPHGCVSWNCMMNLHQNRKSVTPSRVCELKFTVWSKCGNSPQVTPSRVCELKCKLGFPQFIR